MSITFCILQMKFNQIISNVSSHSLVGWKGDEEEEKTESTERFHGNTFFDTSICFSEKEWETHIIAYNI